MLAHAADGDHVLAIPEVAQHRSMVAIILVLLHQVGACFGEFATRELARLLGQSVHHLFKRQVALLGQDALASRTGFAVLDQLASALFAQTVAVFAHMNRWIEDGLQTDGTLQYIFHLFQPSWLFG